MFRITRVRNSHISNQYMRYMSLKYTKEHEWVETHVDGQNLKIGISRFAQKELGDITYIDIDSITVGNVYEKGDELCNIESVKSTSDISMPVGGEIVEINTELLDNPSIINEVEKETDAWIVKCKPTNLDDFNRLMDEKEYNKYTQT